MNNMTKKLINDGSETKRVQMSLKCIKIGAALLVLAIVSFVGALIGPASFEDFFVAASYLAFFGSLVAFLAAGVRNLIYTFKNKKENLKP